MRVHNYIERDALGVKPLYFWRKNPLIFSESVLDLLNRGVPRKLSCYGFWSYMLCGAVQEPFTLIDDVYSLPPGCRLVDGKVERVWQPSFKIGQWTETSAQDAITDALEKVVRDMLTAHGGIPCAFLSGGIDSGSLVAIMRNVLDKDAEIRTGCVVHEDASLDERKWARITAQRNHTRHEEFMLTGEAFNRLIIPALDCYDQPSVDGINSYIACKFASEAGFENVISGEGGDELFVGYDYFRKPRQAYALAKKMSFVGLRGSPLGNAIGWVITQLSGKEKFKKLGQLVASDCDSYFLTRRQFDPWWIRRLVNNASLRHFPAGMYDEMQTSLGTDIDFGNDVINRCSWMEVRHNLLSMYVRDGVQTSASFGLKVLLPLLTKELVELLFTIPGHLKCDLSTSKYLLVNAAKGGLPDECVHKPKQGFALPFDRYFKTELREMFEKFVVSGGTGIFKREELARVWNLYLNNKTSWMRIWQLFVIDHWIERNGVEWRNQ